MNVVLLKKSKTRGPSSFIFNEGLENLRESAPLIKKIGIRCFIDYNALLQIGTPHPAAMHYQFNILGTLGVQ